MLEVFMKKIFILIGTVIISLMMTFISAEIFSLYHFGSVPTLLTILYLIAIFSIFEYILLTFIYIFKNIINKQKISVKEVIGRILIFIALILMLTFIIVLDIDWLNWYLYSSPFYIDVIVRCIEFLLPSILFIIISVKLLKSQKKLLKNG